VEYFWIPDTEGGISVRIDNIQLCFFFPIEFWGELGSHTQCIPAGRAQAQFRR
jgi:hypothetical protein